MFGAEGHTFFVTTTVVEFARVFSCGPQYYDILVDSLSYLLSEHHALLRSYVFMPSHIHLILEMPEGENISDFMRDFKKFTSTKVRQQLQRDQRNDFITVLVRNAKNKKAQVFKLWMDRFDDEVIDSDETMAGVVEYIHSNPVKAGLVARAEDWTHSSARDYLGLGPGPLPVAVDWFSAVNRSEV